MYNMFQKLIFTPPPSFLTTGLNQSNENKDKNKPECVGVEIECVFIIS